MSFEKSSKTQAKHFPKVLTCPLCLDVLNKSVMLACIHHICKSCIDQSDVTEHGGHYGVFCPLCHQFSPSSSITEDVVHQDIVQVQWRMIKEDNNCEFCSSATSSHRCDQCKCDMCDTCKDGHVRIPACRSHVLQPLSELTDRTVVSKPMFCEKHPDKLLEFSCVVCKQVICYKCKVLHHDNHKTQTIEEAIEHLLPDVHNKLDTIDRNIADLSHKIKYFNEISHNNQKKYENMKSTVKTKHQILIEKLNTDAKHIHTEIDKIFETKENEIGAQRRSVQMLLATKEAVKRRTNTVLCYLQDVNLLLQLQGELMNILDEHQEGCTNAPLLARVKKDFFHTSHPNNMMGVIRDEDEEHSTVFDQLRELNLEKHELCKTLSKNGIRYEGTMHQLHKDLIVEKAKTSALQDEKIALNKDLEEQQTLSASLQLENSDVKAELKSALSVLEECYRVLSPPVQKQSAFKVFSPPTQRRSTPDCSDAYGIQHYEVKHHQLLIKIKEVLKYE